MKILIVENGYRDLILSRISLGKFLESKGHKVYYACPNPERSDYFHIPMSRNELSIFQILKSTIKLSQIEKSNSIDIVLSFRLVPNLLSYFSSFSNPKIRRTSVITGLGISFTLLSLRYKTIRFMVKVFYLLAANRITIVTQNPDDLALLGLTHKGKVVLGSGFSNELNPSHYSVYEKEKKSINLLYVGRLLKSKGIVEVINIFKKISEGSSRFTLTIVGDIDQENPDSIDQSDLTYIKEAPLISFMGFINDLHDIYSKSDILLFPSKYREGVPRVIIEALSYGLTIITNYMPGCKECVTNNGILIHENDKNSVINYLKNVDQLILKSNSSISRKLFETKFSSKVIYPEYEKIIVK